MLAIKGIILCQFQSHGFPVMYRRELKAEQLIIDVESWCWRRDNSHVLKEQSEYSCRRTDAEADPFTWCEELTFWKNLIVADESGVRRMTCYGYITQSDMNLKEKTRYEQARSVHGVTKKRFSNEPTNWQPELNLEPPWRIHKVFSWFHRLLFLTFLRLFLLLFLKRNPFY